MWVAQVILCSCSAFFPAVQFSLLHLWYTSKADRGGHHLLHRDQTVAYDPEPSRCAKTIWVGYLRLHQNGNRAEVKQKKNEWEGHVFWKQTLIWIDLFWYFRVKKLKSGPSMVLFLPHSRNLSLAVVWVLAKPSGSMKRGGTCVVPKVWMN